LDHEAVIDGRDQAAASLHEHANVLGEAEDRYSWRSSDIRMFDGPDPHRTDQANESL
jgi:hypothetical protein